MFWFFKLKTLVYTVKANSLQAKIHSKATWD